MWCGACVTCQPKFQQKQCFSHRSVAFVYPLAAFLDRFPSRSVATEKLKVLLKTDIAELDAQLNKISGDNDVEIDKLHAKCAAIKIQFEQIYVRQLVTEVEECVLREFDPKGKFDELYQLRRAVEDASDTKHKYAIEQFGDAATKSVEDFVTMCDVFDALIQGGNEVAHSSFKDVAPAAFANTTVVPALHKANVSAAFVSRMVSVFDQKLEKY